MPKKLKRVISVFLPQEEIDTLESVSQATNLSKSQLLEISWGLYLTAAVLASKTINNSDIKDDVGDIISNIDTSDKQE